MRPWLLVSGDFVTTGGQDRANHALARALLARGDEVHLVAHRVAPDLRAAGAVVHEVSKPGGSYFLGEPLLDRSGRRWARRLGGARVVVNGGGCAVPGAINWVHYVHRAYAPPAAGLKARLQRGRALRREREAIGAARLVIANSRRTRRDLITLLGTPPERVEVVYLGVDPQRFRPADAEERRSARAALGWDPERQGAAFVGGLADRRKGFDVVFRAWSRLGARAPLELAVLGEGPLRARWEERARAAGLRGMRFLGKRGDVEQVLRASDLLVAPTRYEPYGLAVHEALCCGLPALVSRGAGVAERYPRALSGLLLDDPRSASELVRRLEPALALRESQRAELDALGARLRARSWEQVAEDLIETIEARA